MPTCQVDPIRFPVAKAHGGGTFRSETCNVVHFAIAWVPNRYPKVFTIPLIHTADILLGSSNNRKGLDAALQSELDLVVVLVRGRGEFILLTALCRKCCSKQGNGEGCLQMWRADLYVSVLFSCTDVVCVLNAVRSKVCATGQLGPSVRARVAGNGWQCASRVPEQPTAGN